MRRGSHNTWVLAVWALLVCACTEDRPEPISHPTRLTVWLEFVEEAELARWMAFAAEHRLNVNVAFIKGEHDRTFLRTACAEAETHDVALTLWPLVTEPEGYWLSQANVRAFGDYLDTIRSWLRADCPRLEGLVLDLEMPIERAYELNDMFEAGASTIDIATFLVVGMDEAAFEAARVGIADLVDDWQARGYRVTASTIAMIADDWADGDESIARALWTPVEGIDWDAISFQIYRSHFDQIWSQALPDPSVTFTSGLVTSYADTIVTEWGDRAAIDLGTTGAGIALPSGLPDATALQSDIAAALAAGIPAGRINIYSLEGLDQHPDPGAWVAVPTPQAAPVDPPTADIRELFALLDAVLE